MPREEAFWQNIWNKVPSFGCNEEKTHAHLLWTAVLSLLEHLPAFIHPAAETGSITDGAAADFMLPAILTHPEASASSSTRTPAATEATAHVPGDVQSVKTSVLSLEKEHPASAATITSSWEKLMVFIPAAPPAPSSRSRLRNIEVQLRWRRREHAAHTWDVPASSRPWCSNIQLGGVTSMVSKQRPELRGRSSIQRLHSSREDVVMCKGTKKEAWLEVRGRSIIPAAIYEQCPGCAGRNGFTGTELEAGGSHSHGSRSSRVFSVLAAAWNVGTTLPKNLAAEKHTTQTNEGPLLGNIG
ncbi:hypothetical protein LR48_Vigan521s000200 [Vigna angularis]|uniref:Uncharacterized protein n=1 Tax=Phaseolus angularis TaxID=3914 RepID=A0A0L9TDS3_PHAAN|nr:hypothetical protein LR48_Vigan521s000200 [Vigna angularis]